MAQQKITEHEIVSALKKVASDLGRVPKRDEFVEQSGISRSQFESAFGEYSVLLQAAGLSKKAEKVRKPSVNELIRKDPFNAIDQYRIVEKTKNPFRFDRTQEEGIIIGGDAHFPFVGVDYVTAFYEVIERHAKSVKYVVQVGDLFDLLAQSRFPRSLNYYSPAQELELGKRMADEFWSTIKKIVPHATCIQIIGNHDVRPIARTLESAPALENFVRDSWERLYTFDNVITNFDYRQEVVIGDIVFHHGYLSQLGAHRDYNLMNSVLGHTHVGGTVYRNVRIPIYADDKKTVIDIVERQIYETNAGLLGDPKSKALGYTPQKLTKWTPGCARIDFEGPRFISFT